MKHEFGSLDIAAATVEASYKHPELRGLDIPPVKAILDALPEPASDDWQECTVDDLLVSDRFKVEGNGWTYEGEVKRLGVEIVCYNPLSGQPIYATLVEHDKNITLYRIPAPVQHPDPTEHPVILIPRYNGGDKEPHWTPAAWNGQYYKTINAPEYFSGNEITNWKPAKVVESDDE